MLLSRYIYYIIQNCRVLAQSKIRRLCIFFAGTVKKSYWQTEDLFSDLLQYKQKKLHVKRKKKPLFDVFEIMLANSKVNFTTAHFRLGFGFSGDENIVHENGQSVLTIRSAKPNRVFNPVVFSLLDCINNTAINFVEYVT